MKIIYNEEHQIRIRTNAGEFIISHEQGRTYLTAVDTLASLIQIHPFSGNKIEIRQAMASGVVKAKRG